MVYSLRQRVLDTDDVTPHIDAVKHVHASDKQTDGDR